MQNPITGYSAGRQPQDGSTIGRLVSKFGSSIRELFKQPETPLEVYTKSLRELIQSTLYIEEWLQGFLENKM